MDCMLLFIGCSISREWGRNEMRVNVKEGFGNYFYFMLVFEIIVSGVFFIYYYNFYRLLGY